MLLVFELLKTQRRFHLLKSMMVCAHECASCFAGKVSFCQGFKVPTICEGNPRGSRGSGLIAQQVLRRQGVLGFGWLTRVVWMSAHLISSPVPNVPVTS